jgi:REP element-mobilizing transposase RayT
VPTKEAHHSSDKPGKRMTDYRRFYIPGSTWFFTVNLVERRNNRLLVDRIDSLRAAFTYVKRRKPFVMEAVVVMPDHLHCIWRLPTDDADFSNRWSLVKSHFSRSVYPRESEYRKAGNGAGSEAYGNGDTGRIC